MLQLVRGRASSLTLMTPGTALPPATDLKGHKVGGGASLSCSCHLMTDEGQGQLTLTFFGQLTCTPIDRVSSNVLLRWGAEHALPSAASGVCVGGGISSTLMTQRSSLPPATGSKPSGHAQPCPTSRTSSTVVPRHGAGSALLRAAAVEVSGQFTVSHNLRASLPAACGEGWEGEEGISPSLSRSCDR